MTEYVGGGDAAKTMALLWRLERPARPGPKQRIDVERIVAEAVAIADRDGLAGLSMRRVADAVGIGTMSLYTYVPGKAELLEVMVDRAVGEVAVPEPRANAGWRSSLDAYARATLELYTRHPWLAEVATSRTVFGPNVLARFDAAIGIVRRAALPARDVVRVVSVVDGFVRGAAKDLIDAEQAPARTGQAEDDWWWARAPLLDERLEAGDFPHIMAVAAEGAFEQSQDETGYMVQEAVDQFEFGLARILDGVEALVHGR
jgi:AcrR family transcriptional regulator